MSSARPSTVAILGASADRAKFGNKAVRAYLAQGYQVFPIHPKAQTIEGLQAYRSILEVPADRLDRTSLYLPPQIGLHVIEEIAHALTRRALQLPNRVCLLERGSQWHRRDAM